MYAFLFVFVALLAMWVLFLLSIHPKKHKTCECVGYSFFLKCIRTVKLKYLLYVHCTYKQKNVDTGQTREDFRIQCIPYMKKNVLLMVFCSWFLSLLFYFFFNKTLFQNSILTSFYFFFEKKKINNTEHNLRRIFVLIWIFFVVLFCLEWMFFETTTNDKDAAILRY